MEHHWRPGHKRPYDTPYGMREAVHVDPDNNLIRFGSPLKELIGRPTRLAG